MAPSNTTDQIALYNEVLGGRFMPREAKPDVQEDSTGKQPSVIENGIASEPFQHKGAIYAPGEPVPEIKIILQLVDSKGTHIIEDFESDKFNAEESKDEERGSEKEGGEGESDDPLKSYPILRRATRNSSKKWSWQIEIQSKGLTDIFRKIAKNFEELDLESRVIVINSPFRCLFFLRDELENLSKDMSLPPETLMGLTQMLNFIRSPQCHKAHIDQYENLIVKAQEVSFSKLWMLFPPYEPVVGVRRGQQSEDSQCFILKSMEFLRYGNHVRSVPQWKLTLLFSYYDGREYEVREKVEYIEYFEGFRRVDHHKGNSIMTYAGKTTAFGITRARYICQIPEERVK
ncbi:unnamed protein product [Clonostachys rosea]|uniref:DUF7025 domain-containing protein n=1 Tax=Bionectria ochroleuca TaxID=29856 RepID=A0ABY6UM35_BIOOC|nr:unnamed protein product [Clonostachys rosea]